MNPDNIELDKTRLEDIIKNSTSYVDVYRKLGISIKSNGSNKWLKDIIDVLNIDISHFSSSKTRIEKYNKEKSNLLYSSGDISNGTRLPTSKLRSFMKYHDVEECCNICNLTHWRDIPLRLDIDHINENPIDNSINNLQFICPNCHRQKTIQFVKNKNDKETFRGKLYTPSFCSKCNKELSKKRTFCKSCCKKELFKIEWPIDSELQKMLWEMPTVEISKLLGVSDVAIGKRCKVRGLTKPPVGYWRKFETNKLDESDTIYS
jgi:hypothetical protein